MQFCAHRGAGRGVPVSRQSLTKAHEKIKELSWEPTFVSPVQKYGTDYVFDKAPKKDPLKQVLRSYFPMEEEKDNPLLRRHGRRHPRQHVPSGPGALDGVAEAFSEHHPVPGDFCGPGH